MQNVAKGVGIQADFFRQMYSGGGENLASVPQPLKEAEERNRFFEKPEKSFHWETLIHFTN